jgi:hypothetical protein
MEAQIRASKQIPGLSSLSYMYEDRLRKLKLPTLAYKRSRGDMIELYKILTGKYDEATKFAHTDFILHFIFEVTNNTIHSTKKPYPNWMKN